VFGVINPFSFTPKIESGIAASGAKFFPCLAPAFADPMDDSVVAVLWNENVQRFTLKSHFS
jgi:hypothetical protein